MKINNTEYHINCRGCETPDLDTLIGKEEDCLWCDGTGSRHIDEEGFVTYGHGEECGDCYGIGKREYIPRTSEHYWARCDAYGIYTGLYCDDCYDDPNIYHYRKDNYFDPGYAGESLEPEDY